MLTFERLVVDVVACLAGLGLTSWGVHKWRSRKR